MKTIRVRSLVAGSLVALLSAPAWSATYGIRVRWLASPSPEVSGYRIAVKPLASTTASVSDAGSPPPESDGAMGANVQGLQTGTDYQVWLTAYGPGGESAPSNQLVLDYTEIAGRIDTDSDGVNDATDACPGSEPGSLVNAAGCACAQLACDDGSACTTDGCLPGVGCSHAPVACNDGNACTTDTCNPATGCAHAPVACNDGNACTTDTCNPATGCAHAPVACNDGNACTTDTCNPATGCAHAPVACNDGNACTTDTCNPATGCSHAPVACNDGNACTTDTCNPATGCAHAPVACNDGNACTTDTCDPATGCAHAPVACNDGNACTTDSCDPATGCAHAPVACNDGNACTIDTCNPATGCSHAPVIPCNDGRACTTDSCDDGNACTTDSCDPATGCAHAPVACDDGNACTVDTCDPATGCTSTPIPSCCTDDADCGDHNACTTDQRCEAGTCVSTPVDCPAPADQCQTARCDPQAGCVTEPTPDGTPCDDGNLCTNADTCLAGVCTGGAPGGRKGKGPPKCRRFTLKRTGDTYDLTATGTFAVPEQLDLTATEITVVLEDDDGQVVLASSVPGRQLKRIRTGWKLPRPLSDVSLLEVSPRPPSARVGLRGELPVAGLSPKLTWRVRFGDSCSSELELRCVESRNGSRQCRVR